MSLCRLLLCRLLCQLLLLSRLQLLCGDRRLVAFRRTEFWVGSFCCTWRSRGPVTKVEDIVNKDVHSERWVYHEGSFEWEEFVRGPGVAPFTSFSPVRERGSAAQRQFWNAQPRTKRAFASRRLGSTSYILWFVLLFVCGQYDNQRDDTSTNGKTV